MVDVIEANFNEHFYFSGKLLLFFPPATNALDKLRHRTWKQMLDLYIKKMVCVDLLKKNNNYILLFVQMH